MSAYVEHRTWTFEVEDEIWEIVETGENWVEVSETRKNGQEDTHVLLIMVKVGDSWIIEEGESMLLYYRNSTTPQAMIDFFNKNGLPS
jgi:hypothetical protein